MAADTRETQTGFITTLGSIQFAIVILVTIAIVAVIGTVIPQGRGYDFYREVYGEPLSSVIGIFRFNDTYQSPLFIGLLALFGLNLVLCSLTKFPSLVKRVFRPQRSLSPTAVRALPVSFEKKGVTLDEVRASFAQAGFPLEHTSSSTLFGQKGKWGYFGASIVHLSLLVFLAGGMVSLLTGIRGHIVLQKGETADTVRVSDNETHPLGFSVQLENFTVEYYEDFPGRPKTYSSVVEVLKPDGETFKHDIRVNHPLMLNNYTVYQSSFGVDDSGAMQSADADTAVVSVQLRGIPESVPPLGELDMTLGERCPVPGFGDSITVALDEIYRDFRQGGAQGGGSNPTVRLNVFVNGTQRWSVFAFENFPGLNMPVHEDMPFVFTLENLRQTGGGDVAGEEYYTVLGVTRDKGIPLMWAASVLMMAGLVLSFYVRPRRLWVVRDGDTVVAGGRVKGDSSAFAAFVKRQISGTPVKK